MLIWYHSIDITQFDSGCQGLMTNFPCLENGRQNKVFIKAALRYPQYIKFLSPSRLRRNYM